MEVGIDNTTSEISSNVTIQGNEMVKSNGDFVFIRTNYNLSSEIGALNIDFDLIISS